eukprot:136132_1
MQENQFKHYIILFCILFCIYVGKAQTILSWADTTTTSQNNLFESSGWTYNECPDGYVVAGIYYSGYTNCGEALHCLEYLKCVAPQTNPLISQTCYDEDITAAFDDASTVTCNAGYFVRGFWNTGNSNHGCDGLGCIERMRCCQYDTSKITYDETDSIVDWWSCFDQGAPAQMCEVASNQYYLTGLTFIFQNIKNSIRSKKKKKNHLFTDDIWFFFCGGRGLRIEFFII